MRVEFGARLTTVSCNVVLRALSASAAVVLPEPAALAPAMLRAASMFIRPLLREMAPNHTRYR